MVVWGDELELLVNQYIPVVIQIQVHQPYLHVYVCIYIWYLPQRSTIFDLPF